ncbi:MAG: PaaI family thioesterase [Actinomycetota bacterium]|jgi:uncharacterized protein (TIGR00369 family)|nr:PaaI family thioesterase [Actinomycetota bacterium]MDA3015167.1 PaaI family thioesterase [Actinomycetota bacterium]MDA3027395.1 PaaI family thioesterase [Actinomycetota bacterium]
MEQGTPFPLQTMLGFTMERGDGIAVSTLEVRPEHINPHGALHGGIPYTMLDTAMGAAVMTRVPDGHWCSTIDIHIRYLRPCTGGVITATATVRRAGRRVSHVDAVVTDAQGNEIVTASGTFAVVPVPT